MCSIRYENQYNWEFWTLENKSHAQPKGPWLVAQGSHKLIRGIGVVWVYNICFRKETKSDMWLGSNSIFTVLCTTYFVVFC
ncbi:hypothetical protein P8452_71707 [Trifolium repens]|nr:hypothetical protein QL285_046301 [Trifolium repens]WJX89735.1 hypothetical protein P8452_71707 [Trifolium repens]